MAGLNHELSSELLWREFPGELRHTYFQHVLGRRRRAIPPMHRWNPRRRSAARFAGGDALVLVIRGELLRRYPDALIYAVAGRGRRRRSGPSEMLPIFRARIDPDITFLGFDLTEPDGARALVLRHPGAAERAALRARRRARRARGQLERPRLDRHAHAAGRAREARATCCCRPRSARPAPTWAFNTAHMAAILRQRPVQVAFHADRLLPPPMKTIEEIRALAGTLPRRRRRSCCCRCRSRRATSASQLLVRVYPDEIHLDSHQPG